MEPENVATPATESLNEPAKQIEGSDAGVSEGTAVVEAIADAASPTEGAANVDNVGVSGDADTPPQVDPVAPEAIAVQEPPPPGTQE